MRKTTRVGGQSSEGKSWLFARSDGLAEAQREMNAVTDSAADMAQTIQIPVVEIQENPGPAQR